MNGGERDAHKKESRAIETEEPFNNWSYWIIIIYMANFEKAAEALKKVEITAFLIQAFNDVLCSSDSNQFLFHRAT